MERPGSLTSLAQVYKSHGSPWRDLGPWPLWRRSIWRRSNQVTWFAMERPGSLTSLAQVYLPRVFWIIFFWRDWSMRTGPPTDGEIALWPPTNGVFVHFLESVWSEIALPLYASEISDKSETEREKLVSVPAESSHFFPFKKGLYRLGQKITLFGEEVIKNVTTLKKKFRARAWLSFEKCGNSDVSHFLSTKKVTKMTSLNQIWNGKLGRNSCKTDPLYCKVIFFRLLRLLSTGILVPLSLFVN